MKLFIPIYPAEAKDFSGPIVAVMQADGFVNDSTLASMQVGDGPVGPLLKVNGTLEEGYNGNAASAFEGLKEIAPSIYTIKPFLRGREESLKPEGSASSLLIWGLIFSAGLGAFGFIRRRMELADKAANKPPVQKSEML